MSYKEVQELIEVPTIAYLCSLFHEPLGTPDFEIEELEDALVHNTKCEDMFGGAFLDNIVISLLKGCIPSHGSKLTCMNYSLYLTQFLQTSLEDHEEEHPSIPCNIYNPFTDDKQEFSQLTVQEKVKLILQLIDLRLDAEDVPERIKNIPVESLRLEHMGVDGEGALYWYFYGTRLYKETKQSKKSKPKKKEEKQDTTKTKKVSKKGKKIEEDTSDNKDEDSSDLVTGSASAQGWSLVCQTEPDWTKLVESLRKSKKKADKELFEVLNENFLPQVIKMFQDKERDERIRILMMNKRSSSRIVRKEQERKVEEEKRRIEQQEEERLMQIEENRRKKEEKEKALARLKENYNARTSDRESRQKEKVEQLLMEQAEEIKVTREQRLLERKLKRLSNEAVAHEVEKKTRLDDERKRREAVERDHDYLGGRANRQEAATGKRAQRAAAKKEWHRLADFDDGNHRSIRY